MAQDGKTLDNGVVFPAVTLIMPLSKKKDFVR
jgi:hypothetical protein